MRDNSLEILFQSFLHEALLSSSGLGRYVHSAFPLPTTASPTLQGALKNNLGEAVVSCDMPEPCKFLSLDSCQKRCLWINKEVDLAFVPQVGDVDKYPHALGFERLDPFFRVSKQGPFLTAMEVTRDWSVGGLALRRFSPETGIA